MEESTVSIIFKDVQTAAAFAMWFVQKGKTHFNVDTQAENPDPISFQPDFTDLSFTQE